MIYIRYIYSFFENKSIVKNIDKLIEFILLRLLYSFISTYKYNDILSRKILKNIFINNKEWMELLNFLPDLDDDIMTEYIHMKEYIHKNLDKNIIDFYKLYNISLTLHCIYDIKDIISMIVIFYMIRNTNKDRKFNKYTKLMLSEKSYKKFIKFDRIK